MKKSKFTEEQITYALWQAEAGALAVETCHRMGVTEQSLYRWKRKYAGVGGAGLRQLKELEIVLKPSSDARRSIRPLSDSRLIQRPLMKKPNYGYLMSVIILLAAGGLRHPRCKFHRFQPNRLEPCIAA